MFSIYVKRFTVLLLSMLVTLSFITVTTVRAEVHTIERTADHCTEMANCYNRMHPDISPAIKVNPGDIIKFETFDTLDHQFDFQSTAQDVAAANLNVVHPITGPVYVRGAQPGDVLAVKIIDIKPDDFGFSSIIPGFGFLRDVFSKPYISQWHCNRLECTSPDIPGVRIPNEIFPGIVNTMPGRDELKKVLTREKKISDEGGFALPPEPQDATPSEICGPNGRYKDECLRTIPPREFGGNMDTQRLQVGSTLYLPVYVEGGLLGTGDVHFAQGDGEVNGTAIEMDGTVTLRVKLLKDKADDISTPHIEGGRQLIDIGPTKYYSTMGFPLKQEDHLPVQLKFFDGQRLASMRNVPEDLTLAARDALLRMIDWLHDEKGLTRQQAYTLCSIAVDLRVNQLVDVPNFGVDAVLPLNVFEKPREGMHPGFNRIENVHQSE